MSLSLTLLLPPKLKMTLIRLLGSWAQLPPVVTVTLPWKGVGSVMLSPFFAPAAQM